MAFTLESFEYGPVLVSQGQHKGRIGYFDCEEIYNGKECGVVTFGHPFLTKRKYYVPLAFLGLPNTQQLLKRLNYLMDVLSPFKQNNVGLKTRVDTLEELLFVSDLLSERMFAAQFERSPRGARVFISHSSIDKGFVRGLAVDLSARGHQPWLDEWEILAGDSIIEKVSVGIEDADFLIVVLSIAAVESSWVEREWQAKYWDEVNKRSTIVIPVLKDKCNVPVLLRSKKYVDMREENYTVGLDDLVSSIGILLSEKEKALKKRGNLEV
jgi:hypothetical protein